MSGLYKKFLNLINKQQNENEKPNATKEELPNQSYNGIVGPVVKYPSDKTLIDLFLEHVTKSPDNIALVYQDEKLSFRQLNERANQLGRYLRSKYDIVPDDRVGICLDRSDMLIVAMGASLRRRH